MSKFMKPLLFIKLQIMEELLNKELLQRVFGDSRISCLDKTLFKPKEKNERDKSLQIVSSLIYPFGINPPLLTRARNYCSENMVKNGNGKTILGGWNGNQSKRLGEGSSRKARVTTMCQKNFFGLLFNFRFPDSYHWKQLQRKPVPTK